MTKKKKRKLKYRNIAIIIFSCTFIYSFYHIVLWTIDSRKANKEIKTLTYETKVNIITDDDNIKVVNDDPDYYRLYKDVALIDVDFNNLLEINSETKGWLKVNNTNINYPFVQHKDNNYYLKHTFNKKSNGGGWLFLDYRNKPDFNDFNTVIYGHGRKDRTMFGTLGNVLKNGYINKKDNQFIMISTPTKNLSYQIFSAYKVPNTSDYIQTDFTSDEEKESFIKMIKERNALNVEVEVTKDDNILTLSTCYNNDIKIVVHGKLVKYLER